jgi:hypothetical protein
MALQHFDAHIRAARGSGSGHQGRKKQMSKRFGNLVAGGLALSAAAVFVATFPAIAATSYDGLWSVVIVTEKGTCDRTYRYPVRISNASLVNAGDSAVSIKGSVQGNGSLTVTVSDGSKNVIGSGRLSGTAGAGSWSGGDCAGTWEAERRG